MASSRHIDIATGTAEHIWQQCEKLDALAIIDVAQLVPSRSRLVILAPHPDDETLGCAGLIHQLMRLQRHVAVVAVSDGEGSHPSHSPLKPTLPALRHAESGQALACLGAGDVVVQRVGLPDGALADHQQQLKAWLHAHLKPTDILLAPWRLDGHPDHEAVGQVASELEQEIGCKLIEMPIWAWHWAHPEDPRFPWGRACAVALSPGAEEKKRLALKCYRSQIGGNEMWPPVLPANVLAHFVRPYEVFFV